VKRIYPPCALCDSKATKAGQRRGRPQSLQRYALCFDTTAKQSAVLGLGRSSTWAVLNSDKRAGPSANVIKRILSSPTLPPAARKKIEEYVEDKIRGLYGHSERRKQAFRRTFHTLNRRLKHLPKPSGARPRTVACLCWLLCGM
jgi:hypothetical protein